MTTLSFASIEKLISEEYGQATAEVHAAIAWLKGKDAEVTAAEARFQDAINAQQAATAVLNKAGYTLTVGTLNKPAS